MQSKEVGQLIGLLKLCKNSTLLWARVALREHNNKVRCFSPLIGAFDECNLETGGATFGVCNIKTSINLLVIIFGVALPLVAAVGVSICGIFYYRRRKAIKVSIF